MFAAFSQSIQQKMVFLSPAKGDCSLLRDCEEFSLLGSPLFGGSETIGVTAGYLHSPKDKDMPSEVSNYSPPRVRRSLIPHEHAQTPLIPLYEQVQDLLGQRFQKQALHVILQALLGSYQTALHIKGYYYHEEHLLSVRNSIASLWCLLAHVWLEITHHSLPSSRLLEYVVAKCPLTGNHGWIAVTLVRAVVLKEEAFRSSKTETINTFKELCWDGMDRAHGRCFEERVALRVNTNDGELVEEMVSSLPSNSNETDAALDLTKLFCSVLEMTAQLKTPKKSFYTFTDPKAAALLCQEINNLAAYEHHNDATSLPDYPPSGVDTYPLFTKDIVYSRFPSKSASETKSLPSSLLFDDQSATVQDDDEDPLLTSSNEEVNALATAETVHSDIVAHANTDYVVSSSYPPPTKSTKKRRVSIESKRTSGMCDSSVVSVHISENNIYNTPAASTDGQSKPKKKKKPHVTPACPGDEMDEYWMDPNWEPRDEYGNLVSPETIREALMHYLKTSQYTKTAILQKMNVNSNSFRKFMNSGRYKDAWRATENGTYWAAARLLEAAKNRADDHFKNRRELNQKTLFADRAEEALSSCKKRKAMAV